MTEALEDLQDSTSRLEAENRALRKSGSLTLAGRVGSSGSGSGSSGKVRNKSKQWMSLRVFEMPIMWLLVSYIEVVISATEAAASAFGFHPTVRA